MADVATIDVAAQAAPAAPAPAAPAAPAPVQASPAATPAAAPVAPVSTDPAKPMSPREARAAAREDSRKAYDAYNAAKTTTETPAEAATPGTEPPVVVDAKGRVHDKSTGQFLPNEGEVPADGTAGEAARGEAGTGDAPAAATPSADEGADAGAAATPSKNISVKLSETDPLRRTGQAAIDVVSQKDADLVKGILNDRARRSQEAETARAQTAELEKALAEKTEKLIRLEATAAATSQYKQTPEYQAAERRFWQLKDLEEKGQVEEGTASAFWKSTEVDIRKAVDVEAATRMSAVEQEQAVRAEKAWRDAAWQRTSALPEHVRSLPQFQQWYEDERETFEVMLDRGHFDRDIESVPQAERGATLHAKFFTRLAARLKSEPAVLAAYEAVNKAVAASKPAERVEDITARIEREKKAAVEAYKLDAAKKRQAVPPHPLSKSGVGGDPGTVNRAPEEADTSKMGPSEFRRHQREQARGDARKYEVSPR